MDTTPGQLFADSVARASGRSGETWSRHIVEAATEALVAGLDSPSLRILAGQPHDEHDETSRLLDASLTELNLRQAAPLRSRRSRLHQRLIRDRIRFETGQGDAEYEARELRIYVNERPVLAAEEVGANPHHVFFPNNVLVATGAEHNVWVGRSRKIVDDVSTYVAISRHGDAVYWDWDEQWIGNGDDAYVFNAAEYDREVARISADSSSENAEEQVRRGVFEGVDTDALRGWGLELFWVDRDHRNPQQIEVTLHSLTDGSGHPSLFVSLRFNWDGRSPQQTVQKILRRLRQPPRRWPATYSFSRDTPRQRPPIAGWRWRRRP